jgi:hypothetical protein
METLDMIKRLFLSTIFNLMVVASSVAVAEELTNKPAQVSSQAQPPAGTLKVKVIDEAGRPLPARVHLRDTEGHYLFVAGQSTR